MLAGSIKALLREGGFDVRTSERDAANEALIARTVIQIDGDVITFVSPLLISREDLREKHEQRVRDKLGDLRRLRYTVFALGVGALFVPLTWSLGDMARSNLGQMSGPMDWSALTSLSWADDWNSRVPLIGVVVLPTVRIIALTVLRRVLVLGFRGAIRFW